MIFVNVFLFICLSLFLMFRYEKTLFAIAVWSSFLDMLVLPLPNFTVFGGLSFVALGIYIVRGHHNMSGRVNKPYPMFFCTVLIFFSVVCTNIYSDVSHWPLSMVSFVSVYILPYLLWKTLSSPQKLQQYVNILCVCVVINIIYCFAEVFLNRNPIIEWLVANKDMVSGSVGNSERVRFGIKRIQGLFAMNGALGGFCILNALFFLFLNLEFKNYIAKMGNRPFLIMSLIMCAFFTGTRSVIMACIVGMMYVVNKSMFKSKWSYYFVIVIIFVAPFVMAYFSQIYKSFVDTEGVSGSSLSMRETQFELAFYYLAQAFWTGNGIAYTFTDVVPMHPDMYGAESVWIPLMIDQGILGVFVYVVLILYSFFYSFKIGNKVGCFMILAFVVLKSLTSAPGMNNAYFLIYIVLTSKIILLQHTESFFSHKLKSK